VQPGVFDRIAGNLSALGYDGFTVDEEYTASTADAVREWQEDLDLPETGTVELGRVLYAAGAWRRPRIVLQNAKYLSAFS